MRGFLTGIGLGAAIGLWFAPETGSTTRKKLLTRAADFASRLEKKFEGKSEEVAGQAQTQTQSGENKTAKEAQLGSDWQGTSPSVDPLAGVLNTASKTQLRKVPGIGDATARRIIENRPYESEAEIVDSKVMPETVLKKLKDKLVDADEEIA
jgi:DNA uptake protein ComE-like DNA-binding protein